MRSTFANEILLAAQKDKSIILITGDLGFGVLSTFAETLPQQYLNLGIAEQSILSIAAGLAAEGFRPFVYSIGNFPTIRALEQIRNDICYMENPVTIVSVGAGFSYGTLGYSHYTIEDISILRSLGGLAIYSPADVTETTLCFNDLYKRKKPSYLRLGKGNERTLERFSNQNSQLVQSISMGEKGNIIFTGSIGNRVLDAKQSLLKQGCNPRIFSLPYLSDESIDEVLLLSKGEAILTVEEHVLPGGFGSWVLERASSSNYPGKIRRLGASLSDKYLVGNHEYLLDNSNLTSKIMAECYLEIIR